MTQIEKLEIRWKELASKPKSKEEIDEMLELGKKLDFEYSKEYIELKNELLTVGVRINNIYDLINRKEKYPLAIPFLVKHLSINYHDKNKEAIIRALGVKEATGFATPYLIDEYYKTPNVKKNLKWVIGYAIYITATKDYLDDYFKIIDDKSNGFSRQYVVMALTKFKFDKIENYLISLLNQEELITITIEALGKIKSINAKDKIEPFINHKNVEVRKISIKVMKILSTIIAEDSAHDQINKNYNP